MDFKDKRIVESLVSAALQAGYTVDVNDGEETTVKQAKKLASVMAALETTEEDYLIFRLEGDNMGMARLIYGNSPGEIIADHSDNEIVNAFAEVAARTATSLGV